MKNKFVLKFGIVCDNKPGYSKVHLTEEEIVTDWMPIISRKVKGAKESWQFEINEQVVCLLLENGDEGVILGACCSSEDTPDDEAASNKMRLLWPDGTLIEYDSDATKMRIICSGDLFANVARTATIEARDLACKVENSATIEAANIRITGELQISGNLTCSGSITGNQIKAGILDLATHKHTGVQTGSGISGTPV